MTMSLKDYIPAQNRGLRIDELLIFEIGMDGRCGVDLPAPVNAQGGRFAETEAARHPILRWRPDDEISAVAKQSAG